ncbi:MAG: O-antigen ligase family protein [Pleurocapsa minor GSE-CHR-MK-17-07R]|jgi:O-antigen ligase|nr:O-antigen ligase family protein [Pleurocapsa minor GSE-CHR-MK 17-07R]
MKLRLPFIVLAGLYAYLLAYGATYNGMLNPASQVGTIVVLGLLALAVLVIRRGIRPGVTLFDASLLFWIGAFALSTLANLDDFRRISIGLWFMGAYLLGITCLTGLLRGGALKRTHVLDALLAGGVLMVVFGGAQLSLGLQSATPTLVRPVGTLGNPNSLAGVIVVLLPIAITRLLTVRAPLGRVLLTVYALALLVLLAASFSRGGWIGGFTGLVVLGLLLAARGGYLSRAGVSRWWGARSGRGRGIVVAVVAAGIVGLVAGAIAFTGTFSLGGRSLDLRTFIYESAITQFAERPLTGHGLFTFGAGLARLNPTPPTEPHSHAHNLPLNVAAELGLVGLLALGLSAVAIIVLARRALRAASSREYRLLAGACAGIVAFAVHHLTDQPAMNPAVMVTLLLALVVVIAPEPDGAESSGRAKSIISRMPVRLAGIVALAVLLLTGLSASLTYSAYYDTLVGGVRDRAYVPAADALTDIIARDPDYAPYHFQQGMLYSVAAAEGDASALSGAAEAFAAYTRLAPDYTFGWANLAGVRAALGDASGAANALRPLQTLAPDMLVHWRETGIAYRPYDPDSPFAADNPLLPNIHSVQWLMLGVPRVFAPQASDPLPDAVWALLDG